MSFEKILNEHDRQLMQNSLADFIPPKIFDSHAHLLNRDYFLAEKWPAFFQTESTLDIAAYQEAMQRWLLPNALTDNAQVEGLFFDIPTKGNDRAAINRRLADEVRKAGGGNRGLALAAPEDDAQALADVLTQREMVGIKPYHLYAERADTMHATVEEFAPEWMWEVCHAEDGVLMLHIVRERAIADEANQKSLQRLCRKYPRCRLVLAHVARSFNYRHAREGLRAVADLENVWVDTSAVTESQSIAHALRVLGPQRVLFGTDYPVSELRGKCASVGDSFFWARFDTIDTKGLPTAVRLTLVGLESLLCLREACEDTGLSRSEVEDIFDGNARRLLAPHLDSHHEAHLSEGINSSEWNQSRSF